MKLLCTHCDSDAFKKNGSYQNVQRYRCKSCQRFFSDKPRKFFYQAKAKAIDMYLNNVGIRKIARFIGASPTLIVNWIKAARGQLAQQLAQQAAQDKQATPDIVEMDKIYTYVKKQQRAVIWTAYARRAGRVVAYVMGEGVEAAKQLYKQAKDQVGSIKQICTDANSCYRIAFEQAQVREPHVSSKRERHLIESSNSSIRDNLARFNRCSKRYSKSWEMLEASLLLFFHRDKLRLAV